jgi:hypothetical protein
MKKNYIVEIVKLIINGLGKIKSFKSSCCSSECSQNKNLNNNNNNAV